MIDNPPSDIDQSELLILRQQRAKLMAAKVDAIKRDGLPFYKPHPKQDLFHRSIAKRRGAFTGNRFGKSTMGCAEDCSWLRGERPWIPTTDPARTAGIPQRPVKGLVITTDWDKVKEIWSGEDGKLWRYLPRGKNPKGEKYVKSTSRNHSGAVDTVVYNGPFGISTLRFDTVKSFLTNPQGAESSDWDFIHVDEPCPEQMFKAAARGLVDRNGSAWFTLTALKEPWITDAFETDGIFTGIDFCLDGSIFDNIYLPKEAIDSYIATLTPDEIECRIHGKPLHKAGLVYKEFQRDKHIVPVLPPRWTSWMEPPLDWSYYIYIDPHPHTPHMVLFLAVDQFNRKWYFHDIFKKCLISELVSDIFQVLGPRRLVRARLDKIAWTEDPVDGATMADEFARCGLPCEQASKDLSRGILRVQESLRHAAHPFFTPNCKRLIWEIQRWHWDEEKNKPVDKDDHAMECLYRSILDEPRWCEPDNARHGVEDIIIPIRQNLEDLELPVGVKLGDMDEDFKFSFN